LLAGPTAQPDIRIELQRGGLHVKLQCTASTGARKRGLEALYSDAQAMSTIG
jgi:hypothetical protein